MKPRGNPADVPLVKQSHGFNFVDVPNPHLPLCLVQAHQQKFPDGYGFRMDVNEFLRGLTTEGSLFDDAFIDGGVGKGRLDVGKNPPLIHCMATRSGRREYELILGSKWEYILSRNIC